MVMGTIMKAIMHSTGLELREICLLIFHIAYKVIY